MRLLSNCGRQEEKETLVEVETNCKTKKIDCKFLHSFSTLVFFVCLFVCLFFLFFFFCFFFLWQTGAGEGWDLVTPWREFISI